MCDAKEKSSDVHRRRDMLYLGQRLHYHTAKCFVRYVRPEEERFRLCESVVVGLAA
jgi:hypothetical protein